MRSHISGVSQGWKVALDPFSIRRHSPLAARWLARTKLLAPAAMLAAAFALLPLPARAGWYSTNWTYRKAITVDHTKVSNTDQTNFPVLVNLASDADLSAHARSDGFDILFTASDGTSMVSYERERYTNTTGALAAWVRVPVLSATTDTVLFLYYGNATVSDQQNATNVWDTNCKLVYHMNDAGPTTVKDATTNGNNGTQSGGVTFKSAGQIAGATTYANGATAPSQYVSTASQPLGSSYSGSFTYRFWIKVTGAYTVAASSADTAGSYFLDRTAPTNALVSLIAVTGPVWGYQTRYDDGTGLGGPVGGTLSTNTWTHIEMVRDYNSAFRLYVNGAQAATTADSGSKALTPAAPKLGRHATFTTGTPGLNGFWTNSASPMSPAARIGLRPNTTTKARPPRSTPWEPRKARTVRLPRSVPRPTRRAQDSR